MLEYDTSRIIQTNIKLKRMMLLLCKFSGTDINKVTNSLWHQYILTSLDNLRHLHPQDYEMWNCLQEELDKEF